MIGLDGIAVISPRGSRAGKNYRRDNGMSIARSLDHLLTSSHRRQDYQHCALQIHGNVERFDSRATYSSPSVPGLMMAVENIGESLAPYTESDTFLSRDAGARRMGFREERQ